ncbi:hypothetical protein VTP01DRAFT_10545 [Rhizomucor pusillus]|uniref:uncharacterized protein n=1 Tax=Rhizomucor pusillus TaxID=4840 RepID=UPI00374409BD
MSVSIADIFEDYVESLQNLPSEIDQNMRELRGMDEEFQRIRETYTKHRRSYAKALRSGALPQTPQLTASRQQVEKEFKKAIQKQDQKIELAMRMYDLVSRQIERIDSQMSSHGDWIGQRNGAYRQRLDESWRHDGPRKRSLGPAFRKRPTPAAGGLVELDVDPNEPRYCICNQVSFGDMVACDGENCEKEWFHYACVGLVEPPAGKWFCDDCAAEDRYRKRFRQLSDQDL